MVWQNLHPLQHSVILEMLPESPDVLFEVAYAGNKDISEPERPVVVLQPSGGGKCAAVAASCETFVPGRIDLLDIKKDQIDFAEQFFNCGIPDASIGVYTYVYPLFVQAVHYRDEVFCLACRLSSGECHTTFLSEERLLVHSHSDYFFSFCGRTAVKGYGVGVGAVKASERAPLEKNDEPETRPVVSTHRFV